MPLTLPRHFDFQVPDWGEFEDGPMVHPGYFSRVMALGPEAYWRLGESSGSTALDSANAHHGSYTNGPTLGQAGALVYDLDTAVRFAQASSQYVGVSQAGAMAYQTSPFSVAAWVKRSSQTGGVHTIITTGGHSITTIPNPPYTLDVYLGWGLEIVGDKLQFWRGHGSSPRSVTIGDTTLETGKWWFVAGVYDGAGVTAYVNGQADGSGASSSAVGTLGLLRIARRILSSVSNGYLDGTIDELAVFSEALDTSVVAELYRSGSGQ